MMTGIVFLVIRLILAGILITFVGMAFMVLWRDLRTQTQVLMHADVPALSLIPTAGEEQTTHHFTNPEVFLGRDPACELVLEEKTISARHAHLSYHHTQWWIKDLNSTNGTYLNQEKIAGATVIANGDELRCGQLTFQIKIGGKTPAAS
jgi:hypothetical protein